MCMQLKFKRVCNPWVTCANTAFMDRVHPLLPGRRDVETVNRGRASGRAPALRGPRVQADRWGAASLVSQAARGANASFSAASPRVSSSTRT
ncbi:hypothetical protein GCM10010387_37030 [Streptomyces inusitatus]|uniref:Uncharacterized protein n=1 Tax=Streptomyces inusitatus TaxID=68221 RepID=A0A918QBT3_9ACTN|nr:hypothetical protein GCM10010387_37030 [Streptomyces inusitatus]